MSTEYMPEYRKLDVKGFFNKLSQAKLGLIVMAAFCFIWTVYMFVTPAVGGTGFFMITPENGPAGLAPQLAWGAVVAGLLASLATLSMRPSWVLGWVEPLLDIVMLLAGLWGIYSASQLGSFNAVYTVAGVFLALYLAAIAAELFRRGEALWFIELVVAGAVWVISMAGGLNMTSAAAQVPFVCLAFFIAGWGFVYGALKLHAAEPLETEAAAA